MAGEKPKFNPNKPYDVVGNEQKPAFNPNKPFNEVDVIEKDPFALVQEREEKKHALDNIIDSVPDIDEGRKQVLRDITSRGVKGDDLRDAILTLQGKHHKQSMDGSIKYYLDDKGIPRALANNEPPPKGHDINSIWGEKADAEDDSALTTLGKNVYNILPSLAENAIDLVHLPYGAIAGKEADWYKTLKNSANYLKTNTSEASKAPVLNTEGIDEFSDVFDPKRWDFTADNVAGTVGQILKSVGEFSLGGGFVSKAAGVTTKLGKGASLFTASYATQLGETIDRGKEAGLTTEDAYRVGSAINVPVAMVDLALGVEGRIFKDATAKAGRKELVDGLVKGFIKDSEGKVTKEGLDELFKATLVANTALVKNWGKQTLGDVVGEGSQEALQEFIQNSGEQLYDKMSDENKAKFGTDALSGKSFADYLQNFVVGAIGGAPSGVAYNKIKAITKENEQSKTAFGLVQQKEGEDIEATNTRINAYKANIANEVKQGKLTQEQADNALTRINSYKDYNDMIGSLPLDETNKRQLFDLSFQKQALETEIAGIKPEKLNPIEQAQYNVKEKFATDLQKQINEIVLKAQIQEETVLSEKTIKDVDKLENPVKKEGEKKSKLNPVSQAIADKYKKDAVSKKEYPEEKRSYEEVKTDEFNKFHPRVIHKLLSEKLNKLKDRVTTGTVLKRSFNEGKNHIFEVEMEEGKKIRFSSSMIREDEWKDGHLMNAIDETVRKKEGEFMVIDRDKLVNKPVALKSYTIENDGRKKNVVKIYNPENGKFIAWAKETKGGKNDYTQEEINGKDGLIDIEKKIEDIIPPNSAGTVTKNPIKPQPKLVLNVQTPTKDEFVAQEIEALKNSEDNSYDEELDKNGTYKTLIEQHYNKVYGKNVTPESIRGRIATYNNLGKKEKKSEYGRALLNKIHEEAKSIGYQISSLNKGKITLLNDKGTKVYKEPKVRTKDAVQAEKERKAYEKRALNADPIGVAHQVAMDIANGVKFNQDEFLQIMGKNYKGEMPFGLFVKKGGVSFEWYKQRMAELQGIETAEKGDEVDIAQEAAYEVSQYVNSSFRADAKAQALETYERTQNGGMTNAQVEGMAENLKLSKPQVEPIIEVVNNSSEEETDKGNKDLKDAKNDTQEISTATEIVSDYFGQEERTNNPFDDSFSEEERPESKGIIENPDLDEKDMPFQKGTERSKEDITKVVDRIKQVLPNIKVVYDETLKAKGKWNPKTKTLSINPYYATQDTAIHEAGHILIDAMGGTTNRVIKAAIKQLEGSKLWKETAKAYPLSDEYTIDDLGKEVLAEAIGREGAGIFDTVAEQNKFQQYLNYIFDWLKRNLGLEKNIAKNLAKQIISGIGTKKLTGTTGKEQFQKQDEIDELNNDLNSIEEQIEEAEDDDVISELEAVRDTILDRIERLENQSEAFAEREKLINGLDVEKATLPELIDAYVSLEKQAQELTEQEGEKHYADTDKINQLKDKIGYILDNTRKEDLAKKWGKEINEMANKRDLSWREVWFRTMGHITNEFPAIQELYNEFNQVNLDKEKETYSRKTTLDKKAKAVIKEVNKKLGVKDAALGLMTSNSAKYFNYLENNGKYLTLAEAKAKGLSNSQIEYLEAVRELVKEKNKLAGKSTEDLEVIKIDKGFKEAFKDDGFMTAMSLYMGGGNNVDTKVTYTNPLTGKSETVPYRDAQKAILAYSDKGVKEKAIALAKLLSISYKAKKGAYRSDKNINYNGILTSKFDQPYDKVAGYSKDYHAATMQLIDDIAHVKHMNKIVPLANAVELFYQKLGADKKDGKEQMQYGNVLEFMRHWKNEQIYQKTLQTDPTIDAAAKFLRSMTSLTVMSFAVPANIMNVAIGNYNSIRKEGWTTWAKGQKELFAGDKHRAGFGFVGKKANDINNKYQIVKSDLDSNPKNHIGKWFDQLAFAGTRFGEYQIQLSLALGLMKDAGLMDSFTYKNGELTLKEGVNEKEFEKKINEIKDKVSDIQGKYDPKDRRNIARYELGKAGLQFKNWIPDWTHERFASEYIDSKGVLHRGSTRVLSSQAIKEMKADIATHGKFMAVFKGETQAAKNWRSNLNGLMFLTTLYILTHSGDDDEKKKRETLSLENALEQLLFVYDPSQAKYLLKSPIASWGIVDKFLTIIENIVDGSPEKAGKTAKKLIPYNKVTDIPENLGLVDKKK